MKPLSPEAAELNRLYRSSSPHEKATLKAACAITLAMSTSDAPWPLRVDVVLTALREYRFTLTCCMTNLVMPNAETEDEKVVQNLCHLALRSLDEAEKAQKHLHNLVDALKDHLPSHQKGDTTT